MIRTKTLALGNVPVELGFSDEVDSHYTIIITNISANKHALIGNGNVSTTNYGLRAEHDGAPIVLENISFKDKFFGISEDPNTPTSVAIMVIERN